MDLPHTWQGYIQVEETDFRRSTDRQVYKKLGSNINYLIDQVQTLNVQAVATFANSSQGIYSSVGFTTDGSGNYGAVIYSTPDGSPITFAAALGYVFGYRNTYPLLCYPNISQVSQSLFSSGGTGTADTGNFPQIQLLVNGPNNNQLYAQIVNGNTGGTKSSPTWPAHTGGTINFIVIFP